MILVAVYVSILNAETIHCIAVPGGQSTLSDPATLVTAQSIPATLGITQSVLIRGGDFISGVDKCTTSLHCDAV